MFKTIAYMLGKFDYHALFQRKFELGPSFRILIFYFDDDEDSNDDSNDDDDQ